MDEVADMWDGVKDNLKNTDGSKNPEVDIPQQFSNLQSLTLLDDAFLEQAGVTEESDRDAVLRRVQEQTENFAVLHPPKLINDPIHGTISLHPLAVLIMNTPQFQRLHYIKQLSLQYYVYPSAGYSRFEHSVGVYHLAGKLVNMLKVRQPELKITAIDAMCVQLAGLCHDLGHGPFSHLFDGTVIPILRTKCSTEDRKQYENWTHEVASADLLNKICYSNNGQTSDEVLPKIAEWGVRKEDIEFINSLIKGKINTDETETGQRAKKSFLYDIVSNELSGMDVDKWDYLVRDSYHLGLKCGFDPDRLMYHMRVMKITGRGDKGHICVRRKEHDSVYSMFHTRYELYRKALQHPVVNGVEMMVAAAIVEAGDHLKIPSSVHLLDGKESQSKTVLECLGDMVAYTNLHDGILFKILESEGPELKNSRDLLQRVQKRDLWKCVGQAVIPSKEKNGNRSDAKALEGHGEEIVRELARLEKQAYLEELVMLEQLLRLGQLVGLQELELEELEREELEREELQRLEELERLLELVRLKLKFDYKVKTRNFGKKDQNPLDQIGFYTKEYPNKAFLITDDDDRSIILPKEFQQSILFVYCTSEREELEGKETDICKTLKGILEAHGLKVLSS